MIKIYFISTEGCVACDYAIETIVDCITSFTQRIQLEIGDFKSYPKEFLKYHNVIDYPTTIVLKNGVVRDKFTGTFSYDKLKTLLTELFVE